MSEPAPAQGRELSLTGKLAWVTALSFASGLPYGIVFFFVPTYLRDGPGAELSFITEVTSIATFAWTLKFLWAFLIDRFGTRKHWILLMQVVLAVLFLASATISPLTAAGLFAAAVIAIAYASATQDIAIDGYTISLFRERELGPANSARVTAYRVAMIVSSGLLVYLAGKTSWTLGFTAAAALILVAFGVTIFLPQVYVPRSHASLGDTILKPLADLFSLRGFVPALLFIIAFKIGDFALQYLRGPFWIDKGFTAAEIGVLVGTVGSTATILGAIAGGWFTLRLGVFRALWMLGLVQAASNLGYFAAASLEQSRAVAYSVVVIEEFTGGMGTAAFLAFLMSICNKRYAAAQYALLSAAFGLGRTLVGFRSGAWAEQMGYAPYFLLTLALAFPAFLLLPWVKKLKDSIPSDEERAAAAA